jgi:hypothetical protein
MMIYIIPVLGNVSVNVSLLEMLLVIGYACTYKNMYVYVYYVLYKKMEESKNLST